MPILLGKQQGIIRRNGVRKNGKGTLFVSLNVEVQGGMLPVNIWLTSKSAEIAKRSLRAIGYDPDHNSIGRLSTEPTLLAGRKAQFIVEEEKYQGRLQLKCRVDLGSAEEATLNEINQADAILAATQVPLEPAIPSSDPPDDRPPIGAPPPEDDIPF